MIFSIDFIRKYVLQKEGTFLKGFPIKNFYFWVFVGLCAFGILVSICIFLYNIFANNVVNYGLLIGFSLMFITLTLPEIIIFIWFNHRINFRKKQILSDENSKSILTVPYKIASCDRKNQFRVRIEIEYEGKKVILTTAILKGRDSVLPLNKELYILYSPKYNDAIVYL